MNHRAPAFATLAALALCACDSPRHKYICDDLRAHIRFAVQTEEAREASALQDQFTSEECK